MKKVFTLLFFVAYSLNIGFSQTNLTEAVDFTVTTVHGEEFNLFDKLDEGKHVILDFFFTTCPPCIESVPVMNASYERYGCNQGEIYYISIDFNDTDAEVLTYETQYGGLFPSASGIEGGGNAVVSNYGIPGFPTVVLIAPDRSIVSQDIFPVTETNLEAAINGDANIQPNPEACNLVGLYDLEKSDSRIVSTFPNPTRSNSNIEFEIKEAKNIGFEIYNLVGQKVMQIPAENYATGTHNINFSVANLSNGSYTINMIEPQGVVAVTKLVVLK